MSSTALKIAELRTGQFCIVALSGRIDSTNSNDLMNHLSRLILSGEKWILVDFEAVLYLTSAAFRVLLVATQEAERNVARLAFCFLTGHVRELFEIGGLLDLFTIHPSREDALAHVN